MKKKKIDAVLCSTCIYDFNINGVKCCRKLAPNWEVIEGYFHCYDYKKKEKVIYEKEKSNETI